MLISVIVTVLSQKREITVIYKKIVATSLINWQYVFIERQDGKDNIDSDATKQLTRCSDKETRNHYKGL